MQGFKSPPAGVEVYVDLRAVSQKSAMLGFLLLFPGFALYHYLVASAGMPLFLGGLFGNVALALAVLCIALSFWLLQARYWGGLAQARFFLVAWLYFIVWTFTGYIAALGEPHAGAALYEALSSLIVWLAVFFVGSCYPMRASAQRKLLFGSALALFAVFLHSVATHGFLGLLQVFAPGSELRISTYQGVGRSIMVTAIVMAALFQQQWKQLAVLSLALVLLIALGSRAHLFTTFAVIVATLFLASLNSRRRAPLLAFGVAAAVAIWLGWSVFLETRAAEIFDLGSSTSWQGRLEVQAVALDVIRKSPILGEFGYHLREIGSGGYSHNALSAWTEFGLLGFLVFCLFLLYFTGLCVRKLLNGDSSPSWRAAFGLNLASVVLAAAAESVFSAVPALAWGFTVNALLEERRNRAVVSYA